jgi:hypothetical protein
MTTPSELSSGPVAHTSVATIPSKRAVPLALVWCAVLFAIGTVVCSWLVVQFSELGGIGLWAVGGLGGFVARKITRSPSAFVAWVLVGICIILFPIAEVSWIHWKTKQGAELSWLQCIPLLTVFVREYKFAALIGALFTYFGAQSAYWQAGRRYRMVMVAEE